MLVNWQFIFRKDSELTNYELFLVYLFFFNLDQILSDSIPPLPVSWTGAPVQTFLRQQSQTFVSHILFLYPILKFSLLLSFPISNFTRFLFTVSSSSTAHLFWLEQHCWIWKDNKWLVAARLSSLHILTQCFLSPLSLLHLLSDLLSDNGVVPPHPGVGQRLGAEVNILQKNEVLNGTFWAENSWKKFMSCQSEFLFIFSAIFCSKRLFFSWFFCKVLSPACLFLQAVM